ncbi:hypothetical protein TWF506_005336 [Arthrobotrys conoides]|uniref:Uncharacterized protein n=1 Tax=Arthrobotrys conoides TaxID=74498 RepID=A0AAN8P6F4_9PEZI
MSCGFTIDYAAAASANVFYYAADSACLGLPGYVNGSDCASWPAASASPTASLVWSPSGGVATTSNCNAPLFTSDAFPNVVRTTVPCNVQNSVLNVDGVASYIFPTAGITGMSTFVWTIGAGPGSTTTTTAATPYVVPGYTVVPTTIPTTWSTVINSTATVITTQITTVATITQLSTLTAGTTTVMGRFKKRQALTCSPRGPAGSYATDATVSDLVFTDIIHTTTSTSVSTIAPTTWSITNTTSTDITSTTSTLVTSATFIDNSITTVPAATVTETGTTAGTTETTDSDTTTASVATGTMGPYLISIVPVGTTITEGLTRRSLPTGSVKQKRQSSEGWVGLADDDGTVGIVSSQANALQFYVINGELVADNGGVDWYTYTEITIIEDPGYETWVLQASPPGAGSISTEWQGVELDALDWVNDRFTGTGMAQMCVGSPLEGGTINVIDFWYDTTLSPPAGACDLVTASILAVDPSPNPSATETVTSQTTITSISTITGPPVTTYVCNNGGMCPNACTYDTNLVTTEVCSTAADGLSTCQACLGSTPLPVIQTDLAWVTSTVECATPPCQQIVTQIPVVAPTPCDGDSTVTVWGNSGTAGTAVVAAGAAAANTVAAAVDAASDTDSSAATTSATPTTAKSTTRTTTPTASPSMGLAGRVELRSSSVMALAFAGAFAFLI